MKTKEMIGNVLKTLLVLSMFIVVASVFFEASISEILTALCIVTINISTCLYLLRKNPYKNGLQRHELEKNAVIVITSSIIVLGAGPILLIVLGGIPWFLGLIMVGLFCAIIGIGFSIQSKNNVFHYMSRKETLLVCWLLWFCACGTIFTIYWLNYKDVYILLVSFIASFVAIILLYIFMKQKKTLCLI